MKVAVGQFMQESHSFTTIPCTWEQFHAGHIYRGQDILIQMEDMRVELAGGISVARKHNITVRPLVACNAVSSGYIQAEVFHDLHTELLERLVAEMPVDGVFLALHGAMVAETDEDASGTILSSVRDIVGEHVRVVASLDLHANVTHKMVAAADALVGYHTCPHVDLFETGVSCMEILVDLMTNRTKPTAVRLQLPMILPAETSVTIDGPFRDVMEYAVRFEENPDVLAVSVFYVQPWLDLTDLGSSVVVVTNDNQSLANEIAEEIADEFWARRTEFKVELTPLDEAVAEALRSTQGPVILADGADAPSGGASGDSPAILQALLKASVNVKTLINIVDPKAVDVAINAGLGSEVTVAVGGWSTSLWEPVHIRGVVQLISDGLLKFTDAGYQGIEFHRGRTVVLQSGSIYLQIMELPVFQGDTSLYTSVGLDPREAHIVVVKTPTAFRIAYEPFAAKVILVDAPGVTSSNLQSFPWAHLSRPYYPFEDVSDWRHQPPKLPN